MSTSQGVLHRRIPGLLRIPLEPEQRERLKAEELPKVHTERFKEGLTTGDREKKNEN